MSNESIGNVSRVMRYPVKSMQGEELSAGEIEQSGLVGDRAWGVVDAESGRVLSAKTQPELLAAHAVLSGEVPIVTLPGVQPFAADDDTADGRLSSWLDRDVRIEPAAADHGNAYEMSFDIDGELDPDREAEGRFEVNTGAGRFLDLSPLHLLSTASLTHAQSLHPDGNWSPDRFRPTLLLEMEAPDGVEGFVENEWVGQQLRVGPVTMEVTMPMIRCVMTVREQAARGLERDTGIFRTLSEHNDSNLGVTADVVEPGAVSLGDEVILP